MLVDQWPGPVCRYALGGGETVVRGVDAEFRRSFGEATIGDPVLETFHTLGLDWLTQEPPSDGGFASLDRAIVRITGDGGQTDTHLVRNVSSNDEDSGVLLFSKIPASSITATSNDWIDVDDVASVVSHDLRNPLDVATARLRTGREISDNEHFERVAEAHGRMERIIEDVLTLARGDELVEPDGCANLGKIAEDAWEMVRTENATLAIESALPTVVGDGDRIDRLFENLFRNAVAHGQGATQTSDLRGERETDVRLTIGGIRRGSTDGFFVADDGGGIPPEDRNEVFQPGFSTDDHGTGLGLSIVARVVALHGWSIEVTESASGGARFEITGVETA